MSCDMCALCNSTENPGMMGVGNKGAKIMIVADCPTDRESEINSPFHTKSARNLKESLERRGIPEEDIYYTYAVKCPAPDDDPKPKQITVCKDLLDAEIEVIKPKIIVPLGNASLKAVLGKTGITKHRGKAVELKDGTIVMPTFHPSATLRRPGYKPMLLKDLDNLKKLYSEGMNEVSNVKYRVLDTFEEVIEELDRLESEAKILSFDLETTGKSAFMSYSKIVCISLSDKVGTGVAIALYHRDSPFWGDQRGTIVKRLRRLLENPDIPKCAQSGKFDIEWLDFWLDIKVRNFTFDSMLAHYVAISEEQGTQGLKSMAWEFTDMGGYDNELDEYKNTLPEAERHNYDNIPWSILSKYACGDVDCVLRLKEIFEPLLLGNPKWEVLMRDILIPASYAFKQVEIWGMQMDEDLCSKYSGLYDKEVERLTERLNNYPEVVEMEREKLELYALRQAVMRIPAKERNEEQKLVVKDYKKYENFKFNWNSVKQLQELLFDRLKLTTSVRTDTGAYSTNEESLIEMESQHELPKFMLEYRKIATLNNMFIQKLPTMVDKDFIVHPSFNIVGTITGRTSSENPNAQQLPRKSEDILAFQFHHEPKKLFKSRFGDQGCIVNMDYSQLELRIAGVVSKDKTLLQAYLSGEDIHKSTASLVWKVPISEVSKELRTNAKAVA